MRARLSTLAVVAVVGGVAAAALIDSLTGHFRSRSPASAGVPTRPTTRPRGRIVVRPVEVGGSVVSSLVDVGIRSRRPGDTRIRVVAERLRLGPGIGSPSGERIAMWVWNPARPRVDGIYTRDAAGGALERITRTSGGRLQTPIAYSTGGAGILFHQEGRDHGAGAMYSIRADSTHRVRLTPRGMTSECCDLGSPATWGPNEQVALAAFAPGAAGRGGRSAVYVADADGSRPRRITPEVAGITTVRWSPDGRWIAFDEADRPDGGHDLFLVHPDGSGLHVIPSATGANGG